MMTQIEPARIEPDAIYDDLTASVTLGLPGASLANGRRDGSLRHAKRGSKHLYFGRWLVAWLEGEDVATSEDRQIRKDQ